MARQMVGTHTGFSWTLTDGGARFMPGKDACHDSMAWSDLDGDGCIDFIAIATPSGNYEDTDHELVAVHAPSGSVGWRALAGEVSKKISLIDGVLVASTDSASRLRGLDPRTGAQIWVAPLPDRLKEDPFDGDERAPAIAGVGNNLAAFECADDTYHILDVRTGHIVKSGEGKLKPVGAGAPGLVCVADEDDEKLEAWDVARGRCILTLQSCSQVRVVPGPGAFAFIYHGPISRDGAWGVQVRVFDTASMNEVCTSTLALDAGGGARRRRPDDDGDDDDGDGDGDGDDVKVGAGEYNVFGGFLLHGYRLFYGSRHDGDAYFVQLAQRQKCGARPFAPPQPGYAFRSVLWTPPVIVSAWQKKKGTAKIVLVGHDPGTLSPLWQVGDLGGRDLHNVLLTAAGAVLAPNNPGAQDNEYSTATNRCSIRHIDPASGALVTEYPVENVDCVEVHGNTLCAAPTYFSGGLPVTYDVARRERVL